MSIFFFCLFPVYLCAAGLNQSVSSKGLRSWCFMHVCMFYRGWRWTLAVRECPCPVSSSNPCRESPDTPSSSKTYVHLNNQLFPIYRVKNRYIENKKVLQEHIKKHYIIHHLHSSALTSLWFHVSRPIVSCFFSPHAQILENTPESHPDHSHLRLALEKAEELFSQINEGVREKENSDRLEWIQAHVQCEGLSEVTQTWSTNTVHRHAHSVK